MKKDTKKSRATVLFKHGPVNLPYSLIPVHGYSTFIHVFTCNTVCTSTTVLEEQPCLNDRLRTLKGVETLSTTENMLVYVRFNWARMQPFQSFYHIDAKNHLIELFCIH